jgi:O-antigen/teichoic acid export membrane protein
MLRGALSAGVTSGASLSIVALTLISGIVLARSLGPEARGDLALAMQWPLLIVALSSMGIPEAVTYGSAQRGRRAGEVLGGALVVGSAQVVLAVLAGWWLVPLALTAASEQARVGALGYLAIVPLYLPVSYLTCALQGVGDTWAFNASRLAVNLAYVCLLLALAIAGRLTVAGSLSASVLATGLAGLFSLWLVFRSLESRIQVSRAAIGGLVRYGARVHVGTLAWQAATRADILLLGNYAPSEQVGFYVAGLAIAGVVGVIPNSLALLLVPIFARAERAESQRALALLIGAGVPLLAIAAGGYAAFVPTATTVALGESFRPAATVGRVLVAAAACKAFSQMLSSVARGLGKPLQSSAVDVAGLVVLLPLLLWLVPGRGALGAAIATAASSLVTIAILIPYCLSLSDLSLPGAIRIAAADVVRLRGQFTAGQRK